MRKMSHTALTLHLRPVHGMVQGMTRYLRAGSVAVRMKAASRVGRCLSRHSWSLEGCPGDDRREKRGASELSLLSPRQANRPGSALRSREYWV